MHQHIDHIKNLLSQMLEVLPPSHHGLVDDIYNELGKLNKALQTQASAQAATDATLDLATGCYRFTNDEGFYCPPCYDNQHQKIATQRINSKLRVCPQCRSSLKAR